MCIDLRDRVAEFRDERPILRAEMLCASTIRVRVFMPPTFPADRNDPLRPQFALLTLPRFRKVRFSTVIRLNKQ